MLKKSASPEKVEAQAKVEAKKRTSDLRSTLTSTSAYLLAAALLDGLFEHPASHYYSMTIRNITVSFERKLRFPQPANENP
jgi:hypothetical protein